MLSFKNTLITFTILLGGALGKGGFRGGPGNRGGPGGPGGPPRDPFGGQKGPGNGPRPELERAELMCEAEETFACSSRRVEDGIMACRTTTDDEGNILFEKTLCVDPLNATTLDSCGCCGTDCIVSCPCECENGAGYLTEPVRKRPPREGDEEMEDEMPDDVFKVVVCAEQLNAITAVNMGRATCLEECTL